MRPRSDEKGISATRGSRVGTQDRGDSLRSGDDPSCVIVTLKAGNDRLVPNLTAQRIREQRLEPVADLDPHPSLGGCNEQQDPVIQVLPADAPLVEQLVRVSIDGLAAERRNRDHRDLRGRLPLDGSREVLERCPLFGREQIGKVMDAGRRIFRRHDRQQHRRHENRQLHGPRSKREIFSRITAGRAVLYHTDPGHAARVCAIFLRRRGKLPTPVFPLLLRFLWLTLLLGLPTAPS